MRTRHRVPSIFNLSMVDVLCCALGCVILLWLLNLREARQRADEASQTDEQLTLTRKELALAVQDRDGLRRQLDDAAEHLARMTASARTLQAQLDETTRQALATQKKLQAAEDQTRTTATQLDKTQAERDTVRSQLADLTKAMLALEARKKDVEDRLSHKGDEYADLDRKMSAAVQRILALESQVREKDSLADANARRADGLATKLADADVRIKNLQPVAEMVPSLRDKVTREEALTKGMQTEVADLLQKLALADKSYKDVVALRDKDLTDAKADRMRMTQAEERALSLMREVAELHGDRKALQTEVDRVKATADNRFAGIALTGRRVIFLVDMSGSMDLVDERTRAPEKWKGVRDTLARILRSLPEVEKFQVLVFSEKTSYLLGGEDRWFDYDPKTSVNRIVEALAATKPVGGTNMYSAMETAFRFRNQGLDTIYLLSDGLPNMGDGLTAEAARTLKETEQSEILSRYIRQKLKNDWNRPMANRERVRINTVGFFYESPDVGAFLWALARENDGSFVGMSKP
jgi:predicted  nucleic acid-binding Zn-ribbon protein